MMWRRWSHHLMLMVTLVLLVVLGILVNFIAIRRYARVDLTKTKSSTLSAQTIQVLTHLTEPVSVAVFYQPQTAEGQRNPLYPLLADLLKEYERYAPRLTVEYIDPFRDRAKAEQLAKQFDIDRLNVVIVHAGGRHKYLSDPELAQYDYSAMDVTGQPAIKAFLGEAALTSAILTVTQATQPMVWVTTGHGEKGLEDTQELGLAELKKRLQQANMRAETVTLLERPEVPATVNAVIIAGPTRRFTDQELQLLATYLERGGRLLALLDPETDTGLDALLNAWGVEVGRDIVVDPARQLPFVSAANLFVTTYTQHPIVDKIQTLMTLFPLARSIRPAATHEGLKVTALALTSPKGWGEMTTEVSAFQFNEDKDLRGPVSIAVAVEHLPAPDASGAQAGQPDSPQAGQTETQRVAARLVVIGDSDFVSNSQLSNVGNLDFALGCLNWLVAQEHLIGIGPKPMESLRLHFTAVQMTGLFWLSFAGLPLLFALLGVVMWWSRRT